MGARENEFGRLVEKARREKELSKSLLGIRVGELPESGRHFDAAGINRVIYGIGVNVDHELVTGFIKALAPYLDPAAAWRAAGLWPPGLSEADYRTFLAAGGMTTHRATAASRAGSNPKWQSWTRRTHVRVRHLPVPRTADHAPLAT